VLQPAAGPVGGGREDRGAEPKSGGMQLINECTVEIEGEGKPACVAQTISVVYGS